MERITDGRIYTEDLTDDFSSVATRVLSEYKTLHRTIDKTFQYRTEQEALDLLLPNSNQVIIEEEYLLIYTIEESWFCTDRVLSEVLLKRISKGTTTMAYVVKCMEFLAKHHGCNKIQVGTLAQEGNALSRLYQRHGFNELTRVFTKDI